MDHNCKPDKAAPAASDRKKYLRWTLLSILIAALTIWAVSAQWKDFSFPLLFEYLAHADPLWLTLAVAAMLGFIYFEGCAIRSACRALQYPTTHRAGAVYSAADIYFSAITPSASGGQPASAFMMMRDGIPGSVAAAILMLTLTMYTLSILVIGLLCLLLAPQVFLSFGPFARLLILIGFVLQLALLILFALLIGKEGLFRRICFGVLRFLAALHLIRNLPAKEERLERMMQTYHSRAALLTGRRRLLLKSFLYNFLQRVSVILVPVFVYLALGGSPRVAPRLFVMQSFVVIGSNSVPIPGAMGVADFLMLDGFEAFLPADQIVSLELISRSLSFYLCVILCGLIVLFSTYRKRKVDRP
jgi:hypothetical protein